MQKVLIIKLGALGDVVMSLPLIRQIQQHHASAELFLLTAPAYAGLFARWPDLNVRAFARKGWRASWQALRWIRKQDFARIYDLQSNDRSGLLCALSGVPLRVGNHPRFPYHRHPEEKYCGQNHIFERMCEVLRAAGIDAKNEAPALPVSEQAQEKVRRWLDQQAGKGRPRVLLHAGGSAQHPAKRWPYFSGLGGLLQDAGYCVIWLGGPDEAGLNRHLTDTAGVDASHVFSFEEIIALGQGARFAITNDSGPMHLLSCCRIPVYGLFGPTDWRRSHAVGQAAHVISLDRDGEAFVPSALADLPLTQLVARLRADALLPLRR